MKNEKIRAYKLLMEMTRERLKELHGVEIVPVNALLPFPASTAFFTHLLQMYLTKPKTN